MTVSDKSDSLTWPATISRTDRAAAIEFPCPGLPGAILSPETGVRIPVAGIGRPRVRGALSCPGGFVVFTDVSGGGEGGP